MSRAQSETIGIVLLTAVIALSVTTTGAVVLSEWESDIDGEPLADIESEITPVNITLEHQGGATLYPENTTIYLAGVDEEMVLDERFQPGSSVSRDFDRLSGSFELLVVHDPSDTVVYSETHRITNPVERLVLQVDDWTQPAYVLEGYPANYTVDKEFELGLAETVTGQADVTVDDESKLTVDEDDTTIEGLTAGAEVTATAQADGYTAETEIIVLESDPPLDVETEPDVGVTSVTSVEATGDLIDLGGLPEVEPSFEYSPANRSFAEDADDNGDKLIADGPFYEEPDGYAHNDDYVHDNVPFEPGETRTYYLDEAGSGADLYGSLRTGERTTANGEVNSISAVDDRERISEGLSSGETYRLDVTYDSSGSEFVFSLDGTEVRSWNGLDGHDELYFSIYEYAGSSGSNSLRLIGADALPSATETVTLTDSIETERTFTEDLGGIRPDTTYEVTAVAEQEIDGVQITDSGTPRTFSTDGPTVETVGTTVTGVTSVEATGNLTDLGDMNSADLYFEYGPTNRTFVEDATDNEDKLIADGPFFEDPDGYALNNDYVHDNVPFAPGETRTYYLDEAGSGADLYGSLRTGEQTAANGGVDSISAVDDRERISEGLSSEETYRLDVTYDRSGSEFVFSLDGTEVRSWSGLDGYDELYFSIYEYAGRSGSDSLRLTGVDPLPENVETVTGGTDLRVEGEFDTEIDGLEPDTAYELTAFTDQQRDGIPITDRGESLRFSIDSPSVETVDAAVTGGASIEATGNLTDLGDLGSADLYFEYGPTNRTFVEDATDNGDKLIADGPFYEDPDGYALNDDYVHDNVPFEPGETRTYYLDEAGSGADLYGSLRTGEQTTANGGVNSISAVDDRERIYEGLSNGETYRLDVTYDRSGSEFVFSLDGTEVRTWSGLDGYDELYFTIYEYAGRSGSNSLRLIGADPLPENVDRIRAVTSITEGEFTEEIDGLRPDVSYQVSALTDQEIDGVDITDRGGSLRFSIDSPSVETVNTTATGVTSVEAAGNLTDLGDLNSADLYFEYAPPNRTFVEDATDNEDKLIADGPFYEEPDGYALNDDYVHDNVPFEPGETRTYYLDEAGSGADLYGSLRTGEQTTANGGVNSISAVDDREWISEGLSSEETYRLDVTYDSSGSEFVFSLDGTEVRSWTGLNGYDELYFTIYEYAGSSGSNSLRLVGVDPLPENVQNVTASTNVTDEGVFTEEIDGLDPDVDYQLTALTDQVIDGIRIRDHGDPYRFSIDSPSVETVNTTVSGSTSINATGNLTDLGDITAADLYFEYAPPNRTFVEDPTDNEDKLIADGAFWDGPDGYALDDDYVHDNVPFKPGETRTYYLDEAGSGADLYGSLRTGEQTTANGGVNSISAVDDRERISEGLSSEETYRLDVTYDSSGSEFVFSLDGREVRTWNGLDSHDELYFSIYEYAGSSGSNSLRLIGVDPLPENVQTVTAGTGVTDEGVFTEEIDGLDPETPYDVTAVTEQVIDGVNITDRGEPLRNSTTGPTVETVTAAATGPTSIYAEGELTDLGDLNSADLYFEYAPPNRTFVEDPTDNGDKLIADGAFQESPNGYAHDDDYVHDNVPFEPGETRTYYLDEAGSGADLYGSLRTGERTTANGEVNSISDVDDRERIYEGLSNGETYRLDVTYARSGSEFVFSLDGTEVRTWSGLDGYDELYFSSYEWSGSSGSNSLRLIGVDPLPENVSTVSAETDVTDEDTFSEALTGLDAETTYDVTALTDQTVDGIPIVDRGIPERETTDSS